MYFTKPESPETLERFYRAVRPGGPGWKRQQEQTGVAPAQSLSLSLQRTGAAVLILFGAMFSVGGFLLLRWDVGITMLGVALVGGLVLRRLRTQPVASVS
jgi:hypothetical protein